MTSILEANRQTGIALDNADRNLLRVRESANAADKQLLSLESAKADLEKGVIDAQAALDAIKASNTSFGTERENFKSSMDQALHDAQSTLEKLITDSKNVEKAVKISEDLLGQDGEGKIDQIVKSALENETVREAIISSASFPAGAVLAFNLTTCPKNWTLYQRSIGRYIVGVDENGDTGEEIGIELKENENRASGRHAHTYTYAYVGGNGRGIEGGNSYPRQTVEAESAHNDAIEGTNAPYVQLLFCEKDP